MKQNLNIFIEGVPGSGKSTLLNRLDVDLKGYQCFREGDISPVELAWCAYLTKEKYEQAVIRFPELREEILKHTVQERKHYITAYTKIHTENTEFYQHMEQFEIYSGRKDIQEFQKIIFERLDFYKETGAVFECSFFQNIMDELILFKRYGEEEILAFYREMMTHLEQSHFLMICLSVSHIRENILQIKKERINEKGDEVWYGMMMDYLNISPYGKEHPFTRAEDLVVYFEQRIKMQNKVMGELFPQQYMELESRHYDYQKVVKEIGDESERVGLV